MRRMVRPLVALAAKCIDSTVPVGQLQAFLAMRLRQVRARYPADGNGQGGLQVAADLAEAWEIAVQVGLLPSSEPHAARHASPAPSGQLHRWVRCVPDGKVITARRLVAGTGRWLRAIEAVGADTHREFLDRSLEALLRNVEIRRQRCLQPLLPAADVNALWLEKHDVAILFASTARRRRDLRFLNAAFKLNDWAFRPHRRLAPGPRLARYLLALSHQELAAAELLA